MYKWPQGKILRMILLLLTVVVAGDLARQTWAQFGVIGQTEGAVPWQTWVSIGVLGLGALVALVGGIACVAFVPYTVDRLIEVQAEMARVTWPKQNEVVRSTVIITIMTIVLAGLIFVVDWINIQVVVEGILRRGV